MNKLISQWDGMTDEEKNAWIAENVMGEKDIWRPFFPNSDISAAWEVVEKMRRPFSRRKAFADAMYELTTPSPEDMIVSPLEVIWNMNPMNICKAAYLTIMSKKEAS